LFQIEFTSLFPLFTSKIELSPLPNRLAFRFSLNGYGIFVADGMNFVSPLTNETQAKSHLNAECNCFHDGMGSFSPTSFRKSTIKMGWSSSG
jgi:hypothetical protein